MRPFEERLRIDFLNLTASEPLPKIQYQIVAKHPAFEGQAKGKSIGEEHIGTPNLKVNMSSRPCCSRW